MISPRAFEPVSDPRMSQRSSRGRQPVVENLAVKIVTEGVTLAGRCVRPSLRSESVHEDALAGQACAGLFRVNQVAYERGGNRGARKFAAHDAGRGQQGAIVWIKSDDLPVDEAAYIGWN